MGGKVVNQLVSEEIFTEKSFRPNNYHKRKGKEGSQTTPFICRSRICSDPSGGNSSLGCQTPSQPVTGPSQMPLAQPTGLVNQSTISQRPALSVAVDVHQHTV